MSDERTSPTPNAPRCPVCATGYTAMPGGACPACGRKFAPLRVTPVPDIRQDESGKWLVYALAFGGLISALGFAYLATFGASVAGLAEFLTSPGVYIMAILCSIPVLLQTIRVTHRPGSGTSRAGHLARTMFASCGVAALAGLAAVIAFVIVCIAVANASPENKVFYDTTPLSLGVGGAVGVALFLLIFFRFAPRRAPGPPPPDPED
jgi:hypothetical protein